MFPTNRNIFVKQKTTHLSYPRDPNTTEVRYLDPQNIPIKHQTLGGMTECLGILFLGNL